MNYRYRNDQNYGENMRNYYRQFPNYQAFDSMNNQKPVHPYEGTPNYMPGREEINNTPSAKQFMPIFEDLGPEPFSIDMNEAAVINNNFRQTLWTGEHLQVTLMSIEIGGEIGYEVHETLDQLIYIEQGEGLVLMGDSMDDLYYQAPVYAGYAFIIPAGKTHNLINEGNMEIKLFSVYAPPAHPHGTVHPTMEDAMEEEDY